MSKKDDSNTVLIQDPEYFNHLKSALGEKILPIDVYDFAYEILHKVKFIYSEKATKFCEISTNYLSYVLPVK